MVHGPQFAVAHLHGHEHGEIGKKCESKDRRGGGIFNAKLLFCEFRGFSWNREKVFIENKASFIILRYVG